MRGDEAAYLRGLMTPAGATAAAVAGAGFLATRPGWQAPASQHRVSALTQAACEYAQDLGLAVFPMSREKRPLVKGGFLSASRTCEQLESWFEAFPQALIAAATGALSGIVVLDLDCKGGKNGLEALRGARAALPKTWLARSPSGGYHLCFGHPGEPVPSRASIRLYGRELPGVDVRGNGGAIIVPTPGSRYEWTERRPGACDLAPFPRVFLDAMRWRPAAAPLPAAAATFAIRQGVAGARWQRALDICKAIAGAAPGARQETLSSRAWQAGALAGEGKLDAGSALQRVLEAAGSISGPNWDRPAAIATARRRFEAGARGNA
ncbi:MAG TPA: bifunctional DNA primase/polymerase [Candidatus Defluviicoccus seviourii]|nr:bifunctional DNA primase/polymerase [Candidatus Defluviicoccus seviourii]